MGCCADCFEKENNLHHVARDYIQLSGQVYLCSEIYKSQQVCIA